jgi:hypothetical protein
MIHVLTITGTYFEVQAVPVGLAGVVLPENDKWYLNLTINQHSGSVTFLQ